MPLTSTVTEGLDSYHIGNKLRELRISKKMGLVQLGQHSGLSAALLSKIERGKMYPTLPTLLRIALVFSVGLDYFFEDKKPEICVVLRKDRQRFPDRPDTKTVAYHFESLDFPDKNSKSSAYLAHFKPIPVEDVKLHKHDGKEFLFVLEGRLGLYIQNHETTLGPEDSATFDCSRPHGYRQIGKKPCRAVVIVGL